MTMRRRGRGGDVARVGDQVKVYAFVLAFTIVERECDLALGTAPYRGIMLRGSQLLLVLIVCLGLEFLLLLNERRLRGSGCMRARHLWRARV